MGNVYCVDERLLEEKPIIEVGGQRFAVDNRMSVYMRMSEALKAAEGRDGEFLAICRFGLGDAGAETINKMDLSVTAAERLVVLILAAMQGISAEEAEARFRAK